VKFALPGQSGVGEVVEEVEVEEAEVEEVKLVDMELEVEVEREVLGEVDEDDAEVEVMGEEEVEEVELNVELGVEVEEDVVDTGAIDGDEMLEDDAELMLELVLVVKLEVPLDEVEPMLELDETELELVLDDMFEAEEVLDTLDELVDSEDDVG
jgi:hypothetical protein